MYQVTVQANAGGEMDTQDVTVTVTNEDELGMVTGDAAANYAENDTDAVATYTASGPDAASATWSLDGADAGDFTITGGVLAFRSTPDYENPADMGGDNVYQVTVQANAGGEMDTQDVTVTVTNEDDDGTVTLSVQPVVGIELTASVTDPDGAVTDETWQWARSEMDGTYTDIEGATEAAYTPTMDDEGKYLQAMAGYNDGVGDPPDSAMMVTAEAVVSHSSPAFAEDAATAMDVAEDAAAGDNVGDDPFTATDADGDTPAYALSGADAAAFDIDGATGQITVDATLDYETKASYTVTVEVRDNEGANGDADTEVDDTIDVTITVTNVEEAGTVTLLPAEVPQVGAAITASVTDPDNVVAGSVNLAVGQLRCRQRDLRAHHGRRHVGELHTGGWRRGQLPAGDGQLYRRVWRRYRGWDIG